MAGSIRIKSADLIQQINTVYKKCDLFQLLHFVEKRYADNDMQCSNITKLPIILKSTMELSFPVSDIQFASSNNNDLLEIYINFMGLYGVDSSLPQHWCEEILNKDITFPLNEFLNIFQHRIYILLYLAWKKFQPVLHRENHNPGYLYYLASLSGGLLQFEKHDKEYAYAGLLGQRVHNAEILRMMISNYLDGIPVMIKQHVPKWFEIDNVSRLSPERQTGLSLNETALLGNKILDVSSTVIITLGPVLFAKAIILLADSNATKKLIQLIKLYVGISCNIKIAMNIIISQTDYMKLGQDCMYLAWNSCLGKLNCKWVLVYLGKNETN